MANSIENVSLEIKKYKRGQHPNSRANLQMFPKGSNGDHSHNGYTLTSTLKDLLHKESEFLSPHTRPVDKLWREQIAREILVKSAQGDVGMVKELLDRVDGKVRDDKSESHPETRIVNIIVIDGETKDLIAHVKERTGKLIEG